MTNDSPHSWAIKTVTTSVIALVFLPCVVMIRPDLYWDADPQLGLAGAMTALGPAGVMWLTVLSVAAAGAALWVHLLAGGRICKITLTLAGFGGLGCLYHMSRHALSLYICGGWLGAVALAVAGLHLGQHRQPRRWMITALAALLMPLAFDAVSYVFVEHPMMLESFQQQESQLLAARGLAAGSTQHQEYARRLAVADATGPFGLSNVFGAVLTALVLIAAAITMDQFVRRPRLLGRAALFAAATVLGFTALWLTRSRGALLACAAGVGLVALAGGAADRPKLRRWLPVAAWSLIGLAFLAVVARGLAGPPDSPRGERSLLFRSYYWQGAGRIFGEHPWLGVGPGSFKDAYTRLKNPLSPEEVVSSHSVFVDLAAMLGLPGLAWCGLLGFWLARASGGTLAGTAVDRGGPIATADRGKVRPAVLAALVLGTQFILEWPSNLLIELLGLWIAGLVLFIYCGASSGSLGARWPQAGLFAAAVALVLHGQIEMTFYHPGATQLAWFVVALAAAGALADHDEPTAGDPAKPGPRWGGGGGLKGLIRGRGQGLTPGLFFAVALLLALAFAVPLTRQQSALKRAASRRQQRDVDGAIRHLDDAIDALPGDPRPYILKTGMGLEKAAAAAARGDTPQLLRMVESSLAVLDRAEAAGLNDLRLLHRRAVIHQWAAKTLGDPAQGLTAVELLRRVCDRSPHSKTNCLTLADLLWDLDQRDEARRTYRRCLQISDRLYLDPVDQLNKQERGHIEQRLSNGGG